MADAGARTNDPRWRAVRRLRLEADPVCVMCGDAIANTVDHLDGTDYSDDSGEGTSWLNFAMTRSLCTTCHKERTSEQGNCAK